MYCTCNTSFHTQYSTCKYRFIFRYSTCKYLILQSSIYSKNVFGKNNSCLTQGEIDKQVPGTGRARNFICKTQTQRIDHSRRDLFLLWNTVLCFMVDGQEPVANIRSLVFLIPRNCRWDYFSKLNTVKDFFAATRTFQVNPQEYTRG